MIHWFLSTTTYHWITIIIDTILPCKMPFMTNIIWDSRLSFLVHSTLHDYYYIKRKFVCFPSWSVIRLFRWQHPWTRQSVSFCNLDLLFSPGMEIRARLSSSNFLCKLQNSLRSHAVRFCSLMISNWMLIVFNREPPGTLVELQFSSWYAGQTLL